MTAQIAILNKNAVALATDSAVTTRNANGIKVHNSANKLFTLSKYHPVGIMVYANAEFMGYPWETLIKVYRTWLGKQSFPRLVDYTTSFFSFLQKQEAFFSAAKQDEWLGAQVRHVLNRLNSSLQVDVRQHLDQNASISEAQITQLFETILQKAEQQAAAKPVLEIYTGDEETRFRNAAQPIAESAMNEVFQELPIKTLQPRVVELLMHSIMSDPGFVASGLVFAGFGDSELLPVVESRWVDAVFANRLRHGVLSSLSADLNTTPGASIIPFAQSETVYRFLQGVDPNYKREAIEHIDTMLNDLQVAVAAASTAAGVPSVSIAEEVATQRLSLPEKLQSLESERFVSPVIDVIDSLPKDDLAAIAESFVNLTSFQRKILREVESVGGPIDVAVISKGDGFIWIGRKHYFNKDLNQSFFANYFEGDRDGDEHKDVPNTAQS